MPIFYRRPPPFYRTRGLGREPAPQLVSPTGGLPAGPPPPPAIPFPTGPAGPAPASKIDAPPIIAKPAKPEPPIDPDSYTIPEFCRRNSISVTFYYQLRREGRGPDEMRLARKRVLISKEAALAWRARFSAAA